MTTSKTHLKEIDNNTSSKLVNEGARYFSNDNIETAIRYFLEALNYNPDSSGACFNLGLCYQKQNENTKAIKYFEKTLKINPKDFEALNNLGNSYLSKGRKKEAIKVYKKAIKINPKLSEGYLNLGIVYQGNNDNKTAIKYYQKAYKLDPRNVTLINNMAVSYKNLGDEDKAINYFNKALEIDPNQVLPLTNLGSILMFKRPDQAYQYMKKAAKIEPKSAEVQYGLAVALQTLGKLEKATETFKLATCLNPEFLQAQGMLYHKLKALADWKRAKKVEKIMRSMGTKAIKKGSLPPESPFNSVYTYQDPKRNLQVAKAWSMRDKHNVAEYPFKPKVYLKDKSKKVNIGYLSADFHDHATMHLISGVLRLHDKKRFNLHAYSFGPDDHSYYRFLAKKYCRFRDIVYDSDLTAAKLINKDKIDILVDLKGHTAGCRLGVLALKPAPISVTWLGFPGTTGSDYVDYLIADRIVLPKNQFKYYTEKIIYLPDTYQPNDDQQEISKLAYKRSSFNLPSDSKVIVFSSFSQPYKIDPTAYDSWMRILKKVPKSVLWLFESNKIMVKNLKNEAKERGVNPSRIVFSGNLPKDKHLARLKLSDIALDTFTYNGHTTTSDCLWAGVPVITLKGNHFASRVSASLLCAIGLPELITSSVGDYEKLAISLAKNPVTLNRIHQDLLMKQITRPLFDTKRFTGNLEEVYEKIWASYQRSQKSKRSK